MHKKPRILAAAGLAATFLLAACGEPDTITANTYDPMAEELANAPAVELPPQILASRTYRCRDNRLIYVDFMSNDTARLRLEQGGDPVRLVAEDGTPPYVGEGHSISENDDQITATIPGRGTQTCRA